MAQQRHLTRAPITEALVDLRTKLPDGFKAERFTELKDQMRSEYPVAEQTRLLQGGIRVSQGEISQTASDKGLHGAIFRSADRTRVAQFRLDGFTFNKLKPYTSWDDVFGEAWRLWHLYAETATPVVITRIAVRYINHITLPVSAELRDYLEDPPTIPAGIPDQITKFLKMVVVHDSPTKLSANLVQALEGTAEAGQMTLILDVDAFSLRDYDPSSDELERTFGDLRDLKNRLFFYSLTEKTMEMFE